MTSPYLYILIIYPEVSVGPTTTAPVSVVFSPSCTRFGRENWHRTWGAKDK